MLTCRPISAITASTFATQREGVAATESFITRHAAIDTLLPGRLEYQSFSLGSDLYSYYPLSRQSYCKYFSSDCYHL